MKATFKNILMAFLSLAAVSLNHDCIFARELISINDGWKFVKGNDTVQTVVHLPHTWNSDAYDTRNYYRGKGCYTKNITIPESFKGKRIYLKFDGAASKSEVSIDGAVVATHVGAYSPQIVDVTPFVAAGGAHCLSVVVDNSDKSVPPYSADFTFMGGLYRDAWLLGLPKTHFDITAGPVAGFKVATNVKENGAGELQLSGRLINESEKTAKRVLDIAVSDKSGHRIAEKRLAVSVKAGSAALFDVKFTDMKGVALWSPENPELYSVGVTLSDGRGIIDSTWCYTGFRTFGFDENGRFLLNGKPYKLRGMCRHQDQKPMGIALTDEQHRRDIRLIKEMGANFIRISHYPQDEAVLEMCDRMGLIAWEEIPVIDYVPEGDAFASNAETMLREMIRSHYNHTSVAMWGYMNEILLRMPRDGKEETKKRTLDLALRLEKVLKEEDPTRMSTMAFHGSDIYHGAGLGEITDVKGWNLYQGWYGGKLPEFEAYLSRQHREHPSHRLIVSEYGAGSDLRLHSLCPEPFDFSMEYQQQYLEHYLPVIEDSAFVAGASHWNFIDFSSANRAESMPHINNKGLVTNGREKKDVYYYYKATWHDVATDTVAHIAARDWKERTEIIDDCGYVVRPIKVYTNLPAVALRVNGVKSESGRADNNTVIFDARLREGDNLVELLSDDDSGRILDAMTINLTGIRRSGLLIDPGFSDFAVNVGSGCYFRSDDSGITWLPDNEYDSGAGYGYVGGKRAVSHDEIDLTDDEPLLQRCLTGLDEYRIDVVSGHYEVELSFAELSAPSEMSAYMLGHNAGSKGNGVTSMNITINDKPVEKDFAPATESGVKTMVKRIYVATAAGDSGISIKFTPSDGGTTLLSAIKVRKL